MLDEAQTQLDETSHAEPNAVLEDQSAKDSQALEKLKADRAECASTSAAVWRLRPQARQAAFRWHLTMRFP